MGTSAATLVEIGALFRDLRRVLKIPLPELARRVGTRIEVIEALEAGQLSKLPEWNETARVVIALTGLAGIDPRPVLAIMRNEMWKQSPDGAASDGPSRLGRAMAGLKRTAASAKHTAAMAGKFSGLGSKAAAMVPAAVKGQLGGLSLSRQSTLTKVAVAVPLLILGSLIVGPGFVRASVASVPGAVSSLARSIEDYVLWVRAPEREGLRWIEVEDPRSRKSDKLPSSGR